MRILSAFALVAVLALSLLTSCSTLRPGAPVKASFEAEEQGWAMRHIPGLKTISDFIPPPSEARIKWDEAQKKRDKQWETMGKTP